MYQNKTILSFVQKKIMSIKSLTPPDLFSSYNTPLRSQYGFFEWYIKEGRIMFCPHLAEVLAFETKDTQQSYDAWWQLTHPDDIVHAKLGFNRVNENKSPYALSETRKLCRDGAWRWFSINGKIIDFDDQGNPTRIAGTCTDVSKIKEAELKLEQTLFLFKENNRIKDCYKKEFSLSELCVEILESFKTLTNSTNALLIFSSTNNVKTETPRVKTRGISRYKLRLPYVLHNVSYSPKT